LEKSFITFLIIIYGFLFSGYLIKKIFPFFSKYSNPLNRIFLILLSPLVNLNAFWSLEFKNLKLIYLPSINILIQSIAIIPALFFSRVLKLDSKKKGSFISCSMLSNIGLTLGGFLCYTLYGERGLYLAVLYGVFFTPYFYFIGFPLMSLYSSDKKLGVREALIELLKNPISIIPISFLLIGLLLNILKINKPEIISYIVTHWITYMSVAGYSFAIGLGLSFRRSISYVKHSLFIAFIKFIFNPIVGFILVFIFGLFNQENKSLAEIVFTQSFMPAAIMSVVLSKLFDLNTDLSNAAWILTNLFAIPIIPIMIYLQRIFLF